MNTIHTIHTIHPHLFREYDIRGIVNQTLTEPLVRRIGLAFAAHLWEHQRDSNRPGVVIGRDGRLSSPTLSQALAKGLLEGGAMITDIGLVPTPGLYFAAHYDHADAGIMITGSHNPPNYNGLKMVRAGRPVYGDEIQALRQRMEHPSALPVRKGGQFQTQSILERYLARLTEDFRAGRPLKVVFDCGNGAAGIVIPRLLANLADMADISGETLYAEVDGTFPNHHPDPTLPETLTGLRKRMQETGAELGIAFDGDGDRIGALDERGEIVWGDRLMMLFAKDILTKNPGATILGDVKCSQKLYDVIQEAGGKPLMWKTGHSLIKSKMHDTGALLAGEMSGHLFFADRYAGFDDALYAAVRLIELVSDGTASLSQRLQNLPDTYATPEIRIPCSDERKFHILKQITTEQRALKADFSDIDGVRVRESGGWWLLRVSNTEPALVARVEAESPAHLKTLVTHVNDVLARQEIDYRLEP